jgi:regulator of chromosome condensation (RCC1) repeat-containing protein/Big-like domain-containing protein/Regulator of Chromosome Condensation (RCC1) repeat protein
MWEFAWMMSLGRSARAPRAMSAVAACALAGAVGCRGRDIAAPRVAATMTATSATIQDVVAAQPIAQPPTVLVRDQNGEPVGGVSVVFLDDAPNTRGYVTTTAADGTASFAWFASAHAGVEHLTATTKGVASVQFVANVHASSPAVIRSASDVEQVGQAGGTLPSAPSLTVRDAFGNPAPGVKVTFAVAGPAVASILNGEAMTDAAGSATAGAWTLGSAPGEYQVTATISGAGLVPLVFRARVNTPFAVSSIAAGGTATCAVASSGGSYCWGNYMSDGLPSVSLPSVIANAPPLVSFAVGYRFACGLTNAGAAYCWGTNASGQLGIGTFTAFERQALAVSGGLAFTTVVAGDTFACGLATTGVVYCWGDNTLGQLADGSTAGRGVPAPVSTAEHFTTIAAGNQHVCAIATTGTTYCWGANDGGQLGGESTNTCVVPGYDYYSYYGPTTIDVSCARAPIVVKDAPGNFRAITASNGTCGLLDSGQAYCWGYGKIGAIPNSGQFTSLAAGNAGVCGITTTQLISCWTYADPLVPPSILTSVPGVAAPRSIVAGHQHWCAIDGAGIAFCWGDNSQGQLGNGTRAAPAIPSPVASP